MSDKILSTRHSSAPPPSTPDSAWLPSSRRRKRNTPSSDTLDFATDCRSPPATPPFTPPPQRIPHNLSRFSALSHHNLDQPDPYSSPIQPLEQRSPRRRTVTQTVSPLSSGTRTRASSPTCSPSSGKGAPVGSLLNTFFSLVPMISSGVCIIFLSALSAVCFHAFAKHPFARKSRTGGRHRCRGYSSQLAHRRGAGGRSLCLESIGHKSPVRPLRKRSLFWVSRLVCTAIVVLLPIALSLSCPGCHDVTSFFQSGYCSRSGCPAVDVHDVFGPVSAHHLANLSDRPCHFLDSTGPFFHVGSSLADIRASSDPPQFQTTLRQLTASGPLELLASLVISWQCGFLGTRGGGTLGSKPVHEPRGPGHHQLLLRAHSPTSPSITMPPDPGSLPPTSGSTSPRRPVPHDSAQPPVSKRRAAASGRWYCPVPSCPDHCPVNSRGWASFSAMKGHCHRHLGCYLEGDLPLDWLREVGYGVCEVCNCILSTKYRGRCPSCWPAFVSSLPRPISGRPLPDDMPPLDLVLTTRIRLRTSVPRGAKDVWGTCLNTALAGVIAHRDSRAWTDLLVLPSLVLPSPSRGGSSRTRRSTNETRRRCQDWLNGVRLELWDPPRKPSTRTPASERKPPPEASFDLDEHTSTRVHALIAQGALRRACTALTADPPVPPPPQPTPQVVDELRLLHPGPTDAHREELDKLRPVSPGAAPDVDPDLVRRALASFAATSGAGPSGLRPSHLQDALRYSSGDLTLRLLAEVTSMMIKGELPEDIRPWLCGASLMAHPTTPFVLSQSGKPSADSAARFASTSWDPRSTPS